MEKIKKNEEYEVEIIDNGAEGEGIAKIDNFTVFVEGAIKGEKVRILIVKVLTSYAYGKLLEVIEPSVFRIEANCDTYKRCGGCNLRHIEYEETLNIKQKNVQNLFDKTFEKDVIKVDKTIGMGNPYYYRNKAQYPIGKTKEGEPIIGIYAERTHEIIPMKNCQIQNPVAEQIAFCIYQFLKENKLPIYDEKTGEGLFRHIVIKTGIRTGEMMCILVIKEHSFVLEKELVQMLTDRFEQIKSIVLNINTKRTNVILGYENRNLYGDGYIYDNLGDYTFKISPLSFYQVNPVQAEMLYYTALEKAKLDKEDILYDLYCGIGTIGIFAASRVKKVYGIEIVEQAILDAKENAKLNKVENIEFFAGDVEKVFTELLEKKQVYPDIIIVDPPRRGLDENTIQNMLAVEPKKIVYISCNPATMVRDIKLLEEKYKIEGNVQPVDMFPFTAHVEVVSVLGRKD